MQTANYKWSDLMGKYLQGTITNTEMNELNRQKAASPNKEEQFKRHISKEYLFKSLKEIGEIDLEANWDKFKTMLDKTA